MEVVITGDALVKLCPSVPQRIGESGGEMASMTQMQVSTLLAPTERVRH